MDILWLSAPIVTAAGFAGDIVVVDRLTTTVGHNLFRFLPRRLVGCTIGAGVVHWFGPMLIVFGMSAAGIASIPMTEVLKISESTAPEL